MSDKPRSPFAGLDKALLRSTRDQQPSAAEPAAPETAARQQNVAPAAATRAAGDATPVDTDAAVAGDTDGDTALASPRERPPSTRRASAPHRTSARVPAAGTDTAIDAALIDTIRRAVKVGGKEVSFIRLTAEEKRQLGDVVYTYKRQGKKTTETELMRIALNYLLEDYRASGERSVLARVLASLLA